MRRRIMASVGSMNAPVFEWLDGYGYMVNGSLIVQPLVSASMTPIPIVGGHTIRWENVGIPPDIAFNTYVIELKSNGEFNGSWRIVDDSRTVVIGRFAKSIYICASIQNKNIVTVKDMTTGEVLFQNGRIMASALV